MSSGGDDSSIKQLITIEPIVILCVPNVGSYCLNMFPSLRGGSSATI